MSSFSPAATYHAELREHLGSFGRAISLQRAAVWAARGLFVGLVVDFIALVWGWAHGQPNRVPVALLVATPAVGLLAAGVGATFARTPIQELARRVDGAAGLQERAVTALELGSRTPDHPLALAQMRDAVEHLNRLDVLETFPLRAPRAELLASLAVAVLAVVATVAPNPWLPRAGASSATNVAHDQAERVQRLADTMAGSDSEIQQLRELLRNGARTVDTRSSDPDAALAALEDLQQRVRDQSAGDDQLAAALAAAASALAGDPSTSQLASAINTGDMRQVSQAASDLAKQLSQMDEQQRQQVAKALQDAANRAARASPSLGSQLQSAASALQQGQGGQQGGSAQSTASQALSDLARNANGAAERQRAANQLESSQNAIERALGRGQSRSSSTSRSSSSNGRSGQSSQAGRNGQQEALGQGRGTGGENTPDDGSDLSGQNGGASQGGDNQDQGQDGGSGYGKGSTDHTGGTAPQLGTAYDEQDTDGQAQPDQASDNPFLGNAGQNRATAADRQVSPSSGGGPTQGGGDNGGIPIGLRDLVKDYFSGLDQNQK